MLKYLKQLTTDHWLQISSVIVTIATLFIMIRQNDVMIEQNKFMREQNEVMIQQNKFMKEQNDIFANEIKDESEYRRSMAAFELILKSGDKMQDFFQENYLGTVKTPTENKEGNAYKMHVLVNNFVKAAMRYREFITNKEVIGVFKEYVRNIISTKEMQSFLFPSECPKDYYKNTPDIGNLKKVIKKNIKTNISSLYKEFIILFYRKGDLEYNAQWLARLCDNYLRHLSNHKRNELLKNAEWYK